MKKSLCALVLLVFAGTLTANAGTIVLNFAGLQNLEPIGSYYAGGLGGFGSGPGPTYGITFGPDSLAIICAPAGGTGNCQYNPGVNVAFFLSGAGDVMDIPAGFTTGFSFFYAASQVGSVNVYSGLDGTGSVLASLPLPVTGGYCNSSYYYSCWAPVGVTFAGTADSVVFTGAANYIGFADITLGSNNPGTPEPGTLALFGTAAVAVGGILRRKLNL